MGSGTVYWVMTGDRSLLPRPALNASAAFGMCQQRRSVANGVPQLRSFHSQFLLPGCVSMQFLFKSINSISHSCSLVCSKRPLPISPLIIQVPHPYRRHTIALRSNPCSLDPGPHHAVGSVAQGLKGPQPGRGDLLIVLVRTPI